MATKAHATHRTSDQIADEQRQKDEAGKTPLTGLQKDSKHVATVGRIKDFDSDSARPGTHPRAGCGGCGPDRQGTRKSVNHRGRAFSGDALAFSLRRQ